MKPAVLSLFDVFSSCFQTIKDCPGVHMQRIFLVAAIGLLLVGALSLPVILWKQQHTVIVANAPAGKLGSGWGKILNPKGEVPESGFKAVYFEQQNPNLIVFQEMTNSIAINYAWSEFHNIPSPSFAGYWVGRVKFDAPATKQISVSQSWSKSRIYIDGQLARKHDNENGSFTHKFTAGEHFIEVEYSNNWHTVEYKVTLEDVVAFSTEQEVAAYLRQNKLQSSAVYYVGLYESSAPDLSVSVAVPETTAPTVLWLDSYSPIDWNITGLDAKLSTIIISSYSPGSRISTAEAGHVFRLKNWVGVHNKTVSCTCANTYFHCEDKYDLIDVAEKLRAMTGLGLAGYAVKYNADSLVIIPFDKATMESVKTQKSLNSVLKSQCEKQTQP
jgi:hypothetical protein